MNDQTVQLISDDDGLAVVGAEVAVEHYLADHGLSAAGEWLDFRGLNRWLNTAAAATQVVADAAQQSARWIKLTPESAQIVREAGLAATKTPGISYAMVGRAGASKHWLKVEHGPGESLLPPSALSGAAGVMAQMASLQNAAQIADYLQRIDEKADDLLRKADDLAKKDALGASVMIERAMILWEEEGLVSDDSWSTVQAAPDRIAATQMYALSQLKSIAEKLERQGKVSVVARSAEVVTLEVRQWLAILASCVELQDRFDVLQLDRAMTVNPDRIDATRRGLERDRENRVAGIGTATDHLLRRIDVAADLANARMMWNRKASPEVVGWSNRLASSLHDFHVSLSIDADPRSWETRQLTRLPELGAQAIQKGKEAAAPGAALASAAVLVKGAIKLAPKLKR